MAEIVYKSAGVYANEIDLSQPTPSSPSGVPAGVIGTADEGSAFVPVTVGNYADFVSVFGATDGEKFGPLAVHQFLKNASALTYLRVLGIGDGKTRDSTTGKVTNAGFLVGANEVQSNGFEGANPYAVAEGDAGRTYFLGCFMSESNGSTIFSDAGISKAAASSPTAATATITVTEVTNFVDEQTFVIIDTAGDSHTFTIETGDNLTAGNLVGLLGAISAGGSAGNTAAAVKIAASINAGTCAATITATSVGAEVTLTQDVGGENGNQTITPTAAGDDATFVNFTGGADPLVPASPIIRGVLLAASGVILTLSGNHMVRTSQPSSAVAARSGSSTLQGSVSGSVQLGSNAFVMLLNGHINTSDYPNVLSASFDVKEKGYFANVLNTDPFKLEETGHLLYGRYDIEPKYAQVTGSGIINPDSAWVRLGNSLGSKEDVAFLVTGSESRNNAAATQPNYESFQDRFTHAKSPFVISQDFGGTKYDLFRVHSRGDGAYTNDRVKITIGNIKPSTSETNEFGTFDLLVRTLTDSDEEPVVLEKWSGLSLDQSSDKYIARIIGDQNIYFDFDQSSSSQKLVVDGEHAGSSAYVRVEISQKVKNSAVPDNGLPMGFRGTDHLVTSGSGPLASLSTNWLSQSVNWDIIKNSVPPPVPFRDNLKVGTSPNERAKSRFAWGVQFDIKADPSLPNKLTPFNVDVYTRTKFFPQFDPSNFTFVVGNNPGAADSSGTVLDCDAFNNNLFTLERIQVRTGSTSDGGYADTAEWVSASYVRAGNITADATAKTRALKVTDFEKTGNRRFGKFSFFLQGGFDGLDIFNEDRSKMLNASAKREMDDSTVQGGVEGSTVAAYRKALDIMGTKSDVDIKLLAIPGLRHTSVTDYAIDTVESRFDSMYIMDVQERNNINSVVTSSASGQRINVKNTVADFQGRALDSSFAAAYFPDVIMTDPTTNTNVVCPPSVAVMGAMSLNDSIGHPWFAPAGFTRGALKDVLFTALPFNKDNLDDIYEADLNPLTSFAAGGGGVVVWGQKTLLANASALDRVNVRRLLIDIRRKVKNVANLMLFEPNRQETLDKFNALVKPIMQNIQEQQGVTRYKVIIDATTTTQADVENNTLRGKIFLQPTRTAEFVALDFVITNQGNFDSV